jgi:hypothetical protein
VAQRIIVEIEGREHHNLSDIEVDAEAVGAGFLP